MKKIFYFMVTVLLLVAILLGMTGCIKKETGNENSSQSQDKIKRGPESPASPKKQIGIEPFGY
jgi:hypothetical protein